MLDPLAVTARLEGVKLLEPRDVYDAALVDVIVSAADTDHWPREPGHRIAVYDAEKCIDAIKAWMDTGDPDEAREWFDYNTSGAWDGQGTPTFRWPEDRNDDD